MSEGRWLAVVGLGEDGIDGLSPAARRLIAQAAFVVGGRGEGRIGGRRPQIVDRLQVGAMRCRLFALRA